MSRKTTNTVDFHQIVYDLIHKHPNYPKCEITLLAYAQASGRMQVLNGQELSDTDKRRIRRYIEKLLKYNEQAKKDSETLRKHGAELRKIRCNGLEEKWRVANSFDNCFEEPQPQKNQLSLVPPVECKKCDYFKQCLEEHKDKLKLSRK
jgi:hypothetical protein